MTIFTVNHLKHHGMFPKKNTHKLQAYETWSYKLKFVETICEKKTFIARNGIGSILCTMTMLKYET